MITDYAKQVPGTVALNARAYDRYKRYSFDFDQKNFKLDFTNGVLIYKSIKGARANPQSQDFMTRQPNVTIWDGVTEAPDETARGDWLKLVANAGTIVWNGPVGVFEIDAFAKEYLHSDLRDTRATMLWKLEGLAVDEGLTMADLRGAIQAFVDAMFGVGLRTRFRTDYFPFTEPSGDVSMECHICRGASAKPGGDPCRVCRSQGWIEIAGCGMVNPRVLVACGIDPDRYSGFAFGLGIERSLMIGHGLTEIRDAVEGDVRFSRAFGMEI